MAAPAYPFHRVVMQWGVDASDGWDGNGFADTTCHEDLVATGTHETDWAVLHPQEYLRQAGYNFASGSSVTHRLVFNGRYTGSHGMMTVRLQDVTNDLTLGYISFSENYFWVHNNSSTFTVLDNMPTGDARIQVQYSLETGDTASWRYVSWEMFNDLRVA